MIAEDRVTAHETIHAMLTDGTPGRFDCRFTSGKCAYADVLPLSSGALCKHHPFYSSGLI